MVREFYYRFKLALWFGLFMAPVLIAVIDRQFKADENTRIIYPAPPDGVLIRTDAPVEASQQQLADASH